MNSRSISLIVALLAGMLMSAAGAIAQDEAKPNILFIMGVSPTIKPRW